MDEAAPLGVLGGTFDPVHVGHLRLAEEARAALGLAEVLWVPAGRPAHRAEPHCPARHRLEMVRLAIAGNPAFALDDGEILSDAPSYSVPTLERLRRRIGMQRPLVLLLGADAFLGLAGWHRWRELFSLAHVAVATRPGFPLDRSRMDATLADEFARRERRPRQGAAPSDEGSAGCVFPFPVTALDVSATTLRAALAQGESVRYLLPDPVLDYIFSHQLYPPQP